MGSDKDRLKWLTTDDTAEVGTHCVNQSQQPRYSNAQQLIEHVSLELQGKNDLGMHIPFDPKSLSAKQKAEIVEYRDWGMKIGQIADLLVSLARAQK